MASHSRVSRSIRPPVSRMRIWRAISCSIGVLHEPERVDVLELGALPSAVGAGAAHDTLASQRSWPFSMSASHISSQRTSRCSERMYSNASSAEASSGAVTTSTSGTPARLRSTRETRLRGCSCRRPPRGGCAAARCHGRAPDQHVDVAVLAQRLVVLRDLIALGQIRIEVVLAREPRARADLRARSRRRACTASSSAASVEHRQRAGQPEHERIGQRVGRRAELRPPSARTPWSRSRAGRGPRGRSPAPSPRASGHCGSWTGPGARGRRAQTARLDRTRRARTATPRRAACRAAARRRGRPAAVSAARHR
jgi:hypothetical protein